MASSKINDHIYNLSDLDEFTSYILDKQNEDSILEIYDNYFETDKLIIGIEKSILEQVKLRLYDIIEGKVDFIKENNFNIKPVKTSLVEGIKVNFY